MCAELNSMMPCNHGYIIWVYRGLGEFWGFVNAFNTLLATCLDLPLFPVLMVDYFVALFNSNQESLPWIAIYMIKFMLVVVGMILNIMNIKIIGTTMIIFTIIILTPFLIGFLYVIPNIDTNQWSTTYAINTDMTYNWSIFISSCLWLHCGFDKLSCVSGETKFKHKHFFIAFLFAIILAWFSYVLPLIAALTVNYSNTDWDKGYLLEAYNEILPGIKYLVLLGGVLFCFSLYVVELLAYSRAICAVAQPYVVITNKGKISMMDDTNYEQEIMHLDRVNSELRDESNIEDDSDDHDQEQLFQEEETLSPNATDEDERFFGSHMRYSKKIRVSICPKWIGHYWERTGAPARAVIVQSIINCFLIVLSFEALIQATIFFYALTWLLEFAAFMRLKYKEPDVLRPFVVPFGLFGAWVITIVKVIVVLIVIGVTASYNANIFLIAIGYNIFVVSLYGIRSYYWHSKKVKFNH
eukprot:307950_1